MVDNDNDQNDLLEFIWCSFLGCCVSHPLGLLQLLRQLLQRSCVSLSHVLDLSLVVFGLLVQGLLQLGHLLLSFAPEFQTQGVSFSEVETSKPTTGRCPPCADGAPELLLSSRGVQRVLQLGLQSLQLLTQVPLQFLCFGPGHLLRFQIFLELGEVRLQFPDLLQGIVLLDRLIVVPGQRQKEFSRCSMNKQ